jgi:uncharacterized protein (DUF39 family)
LRIGFVHEVVVAEALNATVAHITSALLASQDAVTCKTVGARCGVMVFSPTWWP